MDDQRIRDPIHNLIKFSSSSEEDEILWRLIQSAPFQRLRRIKQLGFSEFVYPGASHTRFSHSIGTMQMARRMLEVLTKNKIIGPESDFDEWRQATLCAALLHDVGHGPFSHVFENVSSHLGIKISHEDYTRRIISETEIAGILSEKNPSLFDKTISFFTQEPGNLIFESIISSQLDADRLDFLCRDRYFSGIRFGEVDLEWLFDSLRVENIPLDLESPIIEIPTFVISAKGLSVVEEYLASYSHMYASVYFHKTTRGVEVLISDILKTVLSDKPKCQELFPDEPLITYFSGDKKNPDLDTYLKLDDYTVISLVKRVATVDFGESTELAKRFLERKLLKCFEPPKKPKESPPRKKMGEFVKKLEHDGVRFYQDMAQSKGLKQFEIADEQFLKNILVFGKQDGEPRPIGELSPASTHFADQLTVRFYFLSDDERIEAVRIWNAL